MPDLVSVVTDTAVHADPTPSAQGWFAGGERVGYDHRQIDLAQERLGKLGLRIERLPGGHLTTNEQPEALPALIAQFGGGLSKMPGPQSEKHPTSAANTLPNASTYTQKP